MKYTDNYISDLGNIKDVINNLKDLYGKSILITGGGGLICSAIVDFLSYVNRVDNAGIKIFVGMRSEEKYHNRFPKEMLSGVEYFKYDALLDFQTNEKFDYIIHGASNSNPQSYIKYPVETMLANIVGVKDILEYARANQSRVLFISSSEVYGIKKEMASFGEIDYGFVDILDVRSCYPSSKRAAETLCASYNDEYGVSVVIVRPGHVYGPTMTGNDNRVSSVFPRLVSNGENIVLKSNGLQLRSYCYVLDCVSAIITVLLNGDSGEAYNISNKDSVVTIRQMAEEFARQGGVNLVFANPDDNDLKMSNKMNNSSLTSEKLESLGWNGLFNLELGVERTLENM